jgi:ligand-binding sensor domain-containing protein/signal transduction histidine kinase
MNQPHTNLGAFWERRLQNLAGSLALRRAMLAGAVALQLLLPGRGFALDPAKSVFQFNCQNWTRQNGLSVDKINAITQTGDGYIWLGTQNGLIRFDGNEFKMIPIDLPQAQGQDVESLGRSRAGGIWFAINNGGFGSYDGQTFTAIDDARWSRPDLSATTIMEARDGALWTGMNSGLGRWVKGKPEGSFLDETTTGHIMSLCEDPAGRIWLGTAEHGLYYWAEGKFVQIPDNFLKQQNISALATDSDGQIWIGTGYGLRCYSQGQPKVIPPLVAEVKALLVDSHGILWVGTSGMGLARYENGVFTYLKKADGLGSDYVTSLFEDAEGSLWIGTRDGLSQLMDLKFPIISSKEGLLEGSSHAVDASSKGGLWITSVAGVSYFDGRTITNYTQASLMPNCFIKSVFEARNGDVYLVDGNKNIDVISGDHLLARYTNENWPSALTEDAESVLVASGTSELFRVQNGTLQPYQFKGGVQPVFYWVNKMCVAKDGAIWVASNNGIFRLQNGTFKEWSSTNGLSGDKAQWIFEDVDGSIWAGLTTGIARIKDGRIENIKQADGLPDDRIYAIVSDDHGFFWFDSERGIFRASRQGLNDFADGKEIRIKCELFDGLESVKFTDRTDQEFSGCKTLDGRIWFPSPWGVVMIDPAHIPTIRIAPPVHIDRVLANGREFARSENTIVPPGKGELEVHFTALSFIAPQKIRFRYQLEGYDKDWVETEGRRLAFYTNLKPGPYTFRVMAANADGVWNEAGDSFKIELRPHFYETVWFYLLGVVLACVVLAGIYAWRVRHLRIKQRALQQARDLLEAEVQHRTAELAEANTSLKTEAGEHQRTAIELAQRTKSLENEIEERKQMELELEGTHRQLLETSRKAGMAEIATNVLHNVGNVLNSVNVSASLVTDSVKKSKAANLAKVVALLREHEHDLGTFITSDSRGKQLPAYLAQLSEHLLADQTMTVKELDSLRGNIEHIKHIVNMQQSYTKVSGLVETLQAADLVEDALKVDSSSFAHDDIQVIKEFQNVPPVTVEKHKVLQILVNLVRNAKQACDQLDPSEKRLTFRVTNGNDRVRIAVTDNGIGIPPENLTRIFGHGFTTKKDGHGFGLHSGALAAKEMGGSLNVISDGSGQGATFTLELPCTRKEHSNE